MDQNFNCVCMLHPFDGFQTPNSRRKQNPIADVGTAGSRRERERGREKKKKQNKKKASLGMSG